MKNKFCFNIIARKYLARRKVFAVALGLGGLCVANLANALGLGEITLKSTLDQPLDAEIKLLEVRDLTASEILIGLASEEVFDRQGVERNFFLTSIKYDVVLNGPGSPYVRLMSDRPVREPFLNFILEAQWPSGKLLREYTVLLDLPIFSDEAAAPVSPVQTETVNQQQVIRRQSPTSPQTSENTRYNPRSSFDEGRSTQAPQPSPSVAPAGPSTSYQPSYNGSEIGVQKNDTLWEIALSVRPDRSVSVHQTMMALHRANPDAFINGNINLLKAGRVLRVPDADEIRSLNRQQAVQEVAQHNAEWSSGGAAPLEASSTNFASQTQDTSREGRLSLDSPDESFNASEGRVSGGADIASADIDALTQELSATQETLDKTQGENSDLRSKIDSLENQIQTLESMLEVSSESLRAMELAAAKDEIADDVNSVADDVAETTEEAVDEVSSAVDEVVDTAAEIEESIPDLYSDAAVEDEIDSVAEASTEEQELQAAAEEVVEEAEPEEVKKEAPKVKPIPLPKPSQPSLIDTILEYLPFIGLGVIALLAGIWFFLKRRGSDDDDNDFDAFFGSDLDELPKEDDDFESAAVADEFETEIEETVELEEAIDEEPVEEDSPEPETEDVVAESDIYIAYGKYDQAEEMLLKALNQDPAHHEARLKLLEVYSTQGNLESFDPSYAQLRTNGAPDSLISRAASLRESIAGAGDFDEAAHDTGQFDTPNLEDDSFDLDLGGADEVEDVSLELDLPEASDISADSPELDLELELDDSSSNDTSDLSLDLELGASSSSSDSGDVDFDLEGLDFADESDEGLEDKALSASQSDESDEVDIAALDLAASDMSVGSEFESAGGEDIEFDLEGLDDLELGDSGDIDLELDLGADDADEAGGGAGPLVLDEALDLDVDSLEAETEGLSLEAESDTAHSDVDFDDLELGLDGGVDAAEGPADEADLDELEPAPTQFDMAALDEELDALTSGLGDDLDVSKTLELDLDESDSVEASSLTTSLEDELEADLADLPVLGGDEAQAELDATIAEGEDILAELEVDDSELSLETKEAIDEPDLDFGDTLADPDSSETTELMEEPETGFDAASSSDEVEPPAGTSLDFELPEIDPDATDDGDLDFLSDSDETATKLDLASAYIDMGDMAGAKEIIDEIMKEGSAGQQAEAKALLEKIGS